MAKFEIKDGVAIIPEGTTEIEVSAYSDEMSWVEAIRKVLVEAGVPMHYKDITRTIKEKKYRLKFGDTPEMTVSNRLTTNPDLFKRVEIGVYELVKTSVTDKINLDDDLDEDIKEDESNYKKDSSFIKSTVLSPLERKLLELIVNFPLPLAKGEVCFADILDKLEVEFMEEKSRSQSVDAAILEEKLLELKEQI
jgi:hypothetical protein